MKKLAVASLISLALTFGAYVALLMATWDDPRLKDGYYE